MNYYEFSRRINVFDQKELKLFKSITGICTDSYHRYYASRWLAWYRVFYKQGNTEYRKMHVKYFIEEIKRLYT